MNSQNSLLLKNFDKKVLKVGIDIGTTFTKSSYFTDNEMLVKMSAPSKILYTINGKKTKIKAGPVFLEDKRDQILFYDVKRCIGRKKAKFTENKDLFNYPVLFDKNDQVYLRGIMSDGNYMNFYPQTIIADQLKELVIKPIEKSGDFLIEAVITVPAKFNEFQKAATKQAAIMAGIKVKGIITEPNAAFIYYFYKISKKKAKPGFYLIVDFGGGTCDVSVGEYSNKNNEIQLDIKCVDGDTLIGGRDIDTIIEKLVYTENETYQNIPLSPCKKHLLLKEVASLKCDLSRNSKSIFYYEEIDEDWDDQRSVTRSRIEEKMIANGMKKKFQNLIANILDASKLDKDDFKKIIMVGGTSQFPIIQEWVGEIFKKNQIEIIKDTTIIAEGARLVCEQDIHINDVIPYSIGLTTAFLGVIPFNQIIIPAQSKYPISVTKLYNTVHDFQKTVHITVLMGSKPLSFENEILKSLVLSNLSHLKSEEVWISVTYTINNQGFLDVVAFEKDNNQNIVTGRLKLSVLGGLTIEAIKSLEHIQLYENEKIGKAMGELTKRIYKEFRQTQQQNDFYKWANSFHKNITLDEIAKKKSDLDNYFKGKKDRVIAVRGLK